NYVRRHFMSAGRWSSGQLGYMLMKFSARSRLPVGAIITNAELCLYVVTAFSASILPIYGVHRIMQRWSSSAVNWASRPIFDTVPVSTFSSPALGLLSTGITSLVEQWVSGESCEVGLLIKGDTAFNSNNYFQAATVNSVNCDGWPRLKIDYSTPAVVIGTITPQFINDYVNLPVPPSGSAEHEKDVSLLNLVTILVTNNGPSSVELHVEISPDGTNYMPEGSSITITSSATEALVSGLFARYVKVVAKDLNGLGADLEIYYQGQSG
ncbi:MAG: DNRLRE domain-containing protein, partial [Bacillota bacterium]|nr:DNRLRE domain-containing protein [Bacillota bacterium]